MSHAALDALNHYRLHDGLSHAECCLEERFLFARRMDTGVLVRNSIFDGMRDRDAFSAFERKGTPVCAKDARTAVSKVYTTPWRRPRAHLHTTC